MTTFTDKELIKEIKERISSLDVRDDIERRAYEIALLSLEVEPDEREAYELFMEKRFGDLVDRRRAKNGDNEYMAWDMTLGWIVWQQRAGTILSNLKERSKQTDDKVFDMRADAITRAFDRAVKRARERYEQANSQCDDTFLRDLRFHDLRHEATSRLAEIFPMHELTKITGHKDPRMLMRYYHPKAEDLALKLK
ncbi:CPS-53 (KpLE1) prophage protein [Escherichia coli]|nr:CPS-53 (KpLE1) prophage protein [Escherichia coli]